MRSLAIELCANQLGETLKAGPGFGAVASWGWFIAALFSAFVVSSPAHSKQACVTTGSNNPVPMDNVQDHVGYCGLFADRALLHQYRCRKAPADCKLPAILDLIPKADNGLLNLLTLEKGFEVRDESCLPYRGFFEPIKGQLPNLDWRNLQLYMKLRSSGVPLRPTCEVLKDNYSSIAEVLKLRGAKNESDVSNAIQTHFNGALQKHISSKKCRPRKFPPYLLRVAKYRPSRLQRLLKEGKFVKVGLQVPQPGGGASGPHAIVLTNYKTTCCAGICNIRYEMRDSLGSYWSSTPGENWITEAELEKFLHKEVNMTIIEDESGWQYDPSEAEEFTGLPPDSAPSKPE